MSYFFSGTLEDPVVIIGYYDDQEIPIAAYNLAYLDVIEKFDEPVQKIIESEMFWGRSRNENVHDNSVTLSLKNALVFLQEKTADPDQVNLPVNPRELAIREEYGNNEYLVPFEKTEMQILDLVLKYIRQNRLDLVYDILETEVREFKKNNICASGRAALVIGSLETFCPIEIKSIPAIRVYIIQCRVPAILAEFPEITFDQICEKIRAEFSGVVSKYHLDRILEEIKAGM